MVFFNVFFKTLGFLVGFAVFVLLLNLLIYLTSNKTESFRFVKGDRESENIIATIMLNGPIINNFNRSIFDNNNEFIDPKIVKDHIKKLENIKPKVLILRINSPGGTVPATANLEKILKNFKDNFDVNIYIFTDTILASGGYWIATTGDKIYANYGSILGSIGVSGPSWYYFDQPTSISSGIFGEKIETRNGIQIFDQNAGTSKDLYNPFRKPTSKELGHLKNIVDDIYDDFVLKVSKSRGIEVNILKNEIGALVYSSQQAKDNFLIDDILNYDELIKEVVLENNFSNFKLLEIYSNNNLIEKYLINLNSKHNKIICKKINTNFVSILPLHFKKC